MKKLIVAMLTVTGAFAQAQDNMLSDVMYFPQKNTFSAMSSLEYSTTSFTYDLISTKFSETEIKEIELEQTFSYTFSDKTMLGIIAEYQMDKKTEIKYGPGSTLSGNTVNLKSESGISEPSLFLKQRFLDQPDSSVNLDLKLEYSPKLDDAKTSTVSKKGNGYRGSSELGAELEIGKKFRSNQWKTELAFTSFGKGKVVSADSSADITNTDSYSVFALGYSYQWNLDPAFELALDVGVAFIGEIEQTNASENTLSTVESTTAITFGPTFKFNVSPNLSLDLSYHYVKNDDTMLVERDTNDNSSISVFVNDAHSNLLSFSAKYEF